MIQFESGKTINPMYTIRTCVLIHLEPSQNGQYQPKKDEQWSFLETGSVPFICSYETH